MLHVSALVAPSVLLTEFGGQPVHAAAETEPMSVLYELAPQSWQADWAVWSWYRPFSQSLHSATVCAPVPLWYLPCVQDEHDVAEVAPVPSRYLPVPHRLHSSLPAAPVPVP